MERRPFELIHGQEGPYSGIILKGRVEYTARVAVASTGQGSCAGYFLGPGGVTPY